MPSRTSHSTSRRAFLGGCTALALGLAGCSALESAVPDVSAAAAPSDWSQRFRDFGNTNAAPEGLESLDEQWSRRIEANLDRPLVVDGTILAVAVDREGAGPTRALAIDVESGEDRWSFDLSGVRRARLAAAVSETAYVVGDRVDDVNGERLYAVDGGDSIAWTFDAEAITAVTATESVVFVSVRHGSIVALDAANGEALARLHPAGWGRRRLSDLTPAGRPAVRDGTVFAPFARYDPDREDSYVEDRVVAFDADGIDWTTSISDVRFLDDVTAVGETVYVLTTDRRALGEDPTASLTALEADSGTRRWSRTIEGGATSAVAARDDLVVVSGRTSVAFDAESGERHWQEDIFFGPPVIAGDRVYGRRTEGSFVDTVVAADLETGESIASHTFEYQLNRAPVFANGRAIARTLEYERGENGASHVADRLHALR